VESKVFHGEKKRQYKSSKPDFYCTLMSAFISKSSKKLAVACFGFEQKNPITELKIRNASDTSRYFS
jgi:hypothetical protein